MRHLRSTSFEKIVFDWKPLIIFKGGSRAAATSRMECFVIIVNGWNTKHFILDFAAALDPPLIFAIFVWVSGFSSQPSLMGSDYASDPYSGTLNNVLDISMKTTYSENIYSSSSIRTGEQFPRKRSNILLTVSVLLTGNRCFSIGRIC